MRGKSWSRWFMGVALLLLLLIEAPLFAQNGDGQDQGNDPPSRVARLSYLTGSVSFEPAGESQWSDASQNYPLTTGDRIYTDQSGRAELETGNLAIRVSANTDLTTTNLSDQLVQLGLAQGVVEVRPYQVLSGNAVEVDTSNVAMTITQAGSYRIESYPDQQTTVVSVRSGYVQVSGGGVNQTLRSGESVRLSGTDQVQVEQIGALGADNFDTWCSSRDRGYESSRSAQYVSRDTPGYYDLDNYGNWSSEGAYGPVWYPSQVQAGWVPYRNGRWVWVSPWGWTWVEDEPWGFAPFHYGRWAFISNRWGWIPGPVAVVRPVYAPALVAFVGGEGFSVGIGVGGGQQAWFPLGPGEVYRPWYHHTDNYIRQVNVTNVRNINVTNITNVTNVTNIRYVNRTAVTAVSTQAFRNAQPVAAHRVDVRPEQMARAQIIPHPEAAPVAVAVAGGRPAAHPPVRSARPMMAERAPEVRRENPVATVPGNRQPGSPTINREENARGNVSPERNAPPNRANTQPERANFPQERNASPNNPPPVSALRRAPGTQNGERPQFVTRTPPPAPKPSFEARQPALEQHPGRPLEPQQEQNIRQGRPAGPMRDTEPVPHSPQYRAAPQQTRQGNEARPTAQQQHEVPKSEERPRK